MWWRLGAHALIGFVGLSVGSTFLTLSNTIFNIIGVAVYLGAMAEGTARAIKEINTALSQSPKYIEYLKAEKWNGTLPQVTGGAVPMIDLNRQ